MPTIQTSTSNFFSSAIPPNIPTDLDQYIKQANQRRLEEDFIKSASVGDVIKWARAGIYQSFYVLSNIHIDVHLIRAFKDKQFRLVKKSDLELASGFWRVECLDGNRVHLILCAAEFLPVNDNIFKLSAIVKQIEKLIPDCRLVCGDNLACPDLLGFLSDLRLQMLEDIPFTKDRFDKIKTQIKPYISELKKNEEIDEVDYILEKLKSIYSDMSKVVVANPAQKAVE